MFLLLNKFAKVSKTLSNYIYIYSYAFSKILLVNIFLVIFILNFNMLARANSDTLQPALTIDSIIRNITILV